MRTILLVSVALCAFGAAGAELDVRVRPNKAGVPQIQVNGKAVPPRMFWGWEGRRPLVAKPTWTEFSYDFTPFADERGTVHVRLADGKAGKLEFRDLHVVEVVTGREFADVWVAYPPKYNGIFSATNGMLTIDFPARRRGEDIHLHTVRRPMKKGSLYRLSGSVRADSERPVTLAAYLVVGPSNRHEPMALSGLDPFPHEVGLAAKAGVDFVSYMVPKHIWKDDETYDFSELDRLSDKVLKANPKALLLPRIKIETAGWWAQKHPDHQIVYDDGSKPGIPCISSRFYREKAIRFLVAFTRHMCERYPENFAGVHPAAQNSSEWFYWNSWLRPLNGYDPATLRAWRAWLAAEGDADAATAQVPSAAARRDVSRGLLRDPIADRAVIRFSQFQQCEMADFIAAVAKACREASDGKKLVLIFYGYSWEFSGHSQGPAVTGHLAVQRLLDLAAGNIDILCSPISYLDRAWGECAFAMNPAETVMRNGVLWLWEDDSRTYLDPDKIARKGEGVCMNLGETQSVLRRNTAQEILRGFACWWMDLPACGWYDSPDLWKEMRALDRLDRSLFGRAPFEPDVAAIADERSMLTIGRGSASGRTMSVARKWLSRAGAPYGQYLLSDVLRKPIAAKLQIFQSSFYVSKKTIATMAAERKSYPDVTRVWCWAPGYLTSQGKGVDGVEALTGFRTHSVSLASARPVATEAGKAAGLPATWGEDVAIDPLLAVETVSGDEVWATFADGSAAIVLRGNEVFVASPDWCTELVRALERRAGVHLYLRKGEASVWAAEGWLSFHALEAGVLTLDTGLPEPVLDYYSGDRIGVGPIISIRVSKGETRVLRIGK